MKTRVGDSDPLQKSLLTPALGQGHPLRAKRTALVRAPKARDHLTASLVGGFPEERLLTLGAQQTHLGSFLKYRYQGSTPDQLHQNLMGCSLSVALFKAS